MSEIARLFVSIGAKTEAFNKGIDGVQSKMQSVSQGFSKAGGSLTKNLTLPMVAAGGAALAWANKMGQNADRILDLSAITGMSTGAIQEWQHVAKMAGVDTEAMTNVAQRLSREMTNIEKGTGKAAEAVAALGVDTDKLAQMNADERMDALVTALAGVEDPAERARIGSDLFGRQWEHVAPIVGMGTDELDRLREAGEKYGMSEEDLNKANDFRISMEELKEELGLAAREIGMELMPVMESLVGAIKEHVVPFVASLAEHIGNLITWFKNLSPEIQKFMGIVAAIAVVLGPVLLVVGKIIAVLAAAMPVIKIIGVAIAALASPIGIVIAIIAALVVGIYLLWTNWEEVSAWIAEKWEWLKERVDENIEVIRGIIDGLVAFFSELPGRIWEWLKAIIGKFADWHKEMTDAAAKFGLEVIGAVVNFFAELPGKIWGFLKEVWNKWVEWRNNMYQTALDAVKDIWDAIVNRLRDLPGELLKIGRNMIESLAQGIRDRIGKVTGAIGEVAGTVRNWLPFSPAKEGPLRHLPDFTDHLVTPAKKALRELQMVMQGGMSQLQLPAPAYGAPVGVSPAGTALTAATGGSDTITNIFRIANMSVRDDSDIEKLAEQLYQLQRKRGRSV